MGNNRNQIIRNISIILAIHEGKRKQLERLQDRCITLTSDDGIRIEYMLYDNNIVRYVINGTRSSMSVCFNALTKDLKRKPYGQEPWHKGWIHGYCSEVLEDIKEVKKWM